MAILDPLKFRYIYAIFFFFELHTRRYIGVPEYLSKRVIIRETTHPSRKCEMMKPYAHVPFVSSIYADAAFTIAAPK